MPGTAPSTATPHRSRSVPGPRPRGRPVVPHVTGGRVTASAAGALTVAVLPVFLLGALSAEVGTELGFAADGTGVLVTVLFVVAGLTATAAGRVTERLGADVALRLGVAVAGTATASVALADRFWHVAVLYAIVGATIGLVDTGAARRFADAVPADRRGTAFGIKEASVPAASLLAGLALPTVAGALGWRGTFAAALLLAAVVQLALPRAGHPGLGGGQDQDRTPDVDAEVDHAEVDHAEVAGGQGALVLLAVGVGLGAGTATAAATFLVPSLLAAGSGPGYAGTVLAIASVAAILARIVLGRVADDPAHPALRTVTIALALGAVGAALLVVGGTVIGTAGALLVFAAGWGWTGLVFLAVVRSRPDAPAAAAGTVLTGLALGGAGGPLAFSATAARVGYPTAWTAAAFAMALAAVAVGATVRPISRRDGAGLSDGRPRG
ncbi:MFS transporter [Nitriliruptoraceae bacterium ZYF776]|nr:MFS transporter [Profundirhabdus halotolerans]